MEDLLNVLNLKIPDTLLDEIGVAAPIFNSTFRFRVGPPARVEAGMLLIHPYDLADFFRFVLRSPDNELDLFRLRRDAEQNLVGHKNADRVRKSLRNIEWNTPPPSI